MLATAKPEAQVINRSDVQLSTALRSALKKHSEAWSEKCTLMKRFCYEKKDCTSVSKFWEPEGDVLVLQGAEALCPMVTSCIPCRQSAACQLCEHPSTHAEEELQDGVWLEAFLFILVGFPFISAFFPSKCIFLYSIFLEIMVDR